MGIEEINQSDLLKGQKLSAIYEDDVLDPKTGVAAFRKLVEINKVPVVIGPLTSSVALAIAPIANDKKVVLLSPSASSPLLSDAGDYIFRNVASDEFETLVEEVPLVLVEEVELLLLELRLSFFFFSELLLFPLDAASFPPMEEPCITDEFI